MLKPTRKVVRLKYGSVVMNTWGADVQDALFFDLIRITGILLYTSEDWETLKRADIGSSIWESFWKLFIASLDRPELKPKRITWGDRWTILEAMMYLNDLEEEDLEEIEGKREALLGMYERTIVKLQQSSPTT